MMLRREEFAVLDKLRMTGPRPHQLEDRHQKLRREQLFKAGLKADHYPPPSTSRLENADMTVADWLKARWTSADASVRHSLRLLADALNIPLPLRRTRHVAVQDSGSTRRTESTQQPTHVEQAPQDRSSEIEPEFRYDGPQWHDDDADGWEPCKSLHDAMHPEDRGWY